jgi:benzoyl-CoA reductase/2-hydroxyglutaryl-CoA dehydratase subunit BcrC/BadD/HgdB
MKKPKRHDLRAKVLKSTEKLCVGGYTARDLGSTAVENAARFRIVIKGGESRQISASSTYERDVCPLTQSWSNNKLSYKINSKLSPIYKG